MQILTNFPSLIDRWLRYQFQTILVVCFLLWTPLLVIETLQIQHSCHPMIHWYGTLPAECQPKTVNDRPQEQKQKAPSDRTPSLKSSSIPKPEISEKSPPPQPPEKPNRIEEAIKLAKEYPDITGGVIGIGVGIGVGVTTVTTAPLAVAVGIGAAVWFVIRTVL